MTLSETERGPYNRMREVSDLRTQFQCEYRFHLKQKVGESSSEASVTGSILHRVASEQKPSPEDRGGNGLLPLLIIIVTLIAGLLWILW